jgi:hypothetical protein
MAVVSMLIAAVIKLIVVLLNVLERKPAAALAPAAPAPAPSWPAAAKAQEIAADHLAAIGAAVYAVVGAHRIVHIDAAREGSGWSAEGRLAHHASHAMPTHPTKR